MDLKRDKQARPENLLTFDAEDLCSQDVEARMLPSDGLVARSAAKRVLKVHTVVHALVAPSVRVEGLGVRGGECLHAPPVIGSAPCQSIGAVRTKVCGEAVEPALITLPAAPNIDLVVPAAVVVLLLLGGKGIQGEGREARVPLLPSLLVRDREDIAVKVQKAGGQATSYQDIAACPCQCTRGC